ncbi:hypothetical protein TNIN_120061 [Trichonephila inaurata madagascariensis]|uniref:Uncharacterized protein n=1 Tax=Trichonephila inaurata madagascariensis TaxID=2747483 RepID=A0A8X6WXL5_9ARAC|nr:hypothetical protein TNIN_120061 [Trichonephila inaurata madagascariensis]
MTGTNPCFPSSIFKLNSLRAAISFSPNAEIDLDSLSPSPQSLQIKSSRKTDICAPVSITAFMDICPHFISTNRRSSVPFFVLMETETSIETLAITFSLVNYSSVPLAVIMILLAL